MQKISKTSLDRILIIIGTLLIIGVWILGSIREEADLAPFILKAYPDAHRIENFENHTFKAYSAKDSLLAFITVTSSCGYGGPLNSAVAVDSSGTIIGIQFVNSKDTPSYLEKVLNSPLQKDMVGKSYLDPFRFGNDVDVVSGATFSSQALTGSVKKGSRHIAEKYFNLPLAENEPFFLKFGFIEITLIVLFAIGYIAQRKTFKYKNIARWTTMLAGLIILGFYYNQPLTLSYFSQLLLGYFPDFQAHLYWYIILGGVFLVFTIDNKNPYCQWFCPFGAAQECIGLVGGAKNRSAGKYKEILNWIQRILALVAILLALYFRNPGISSFEVFGTLFSFIGSNQLFAVLSIVLLTSLFVHRPWCKYLCPLKPVVDAYSNLRKWVIELWKKKKKAVA